MPFCTETGAVLLPATDAMRIAYAVVHDWTLAGSPAHWVLGLCTRDAEECALRTQQVEGNSCCCGCVRLTVPLGARTPYTHVWEEREPTHTYTECYRMWRWVEGEIAGTTIRIEEQQQEEEEEDEEEDDEWVQVIDNQFE